MGHQHRQRNKHCLAFCLYIRHREEGRERILDYIRSVSEQVTLIVDKAPHCCSLRNIGTVELLKDSLILGPGMFYRMLC